MAQVTLCDHCGQQIVETPDESGVVQGFARVMFNASQGGSGQLDYHNTSDKACFYAAYEAVKAVSADPNLYPDIAVAPAAPAAPTE